MSIFKRLYDAARFFKHSPGVVTPFQMQERDCRIDRIWHLVNFDSFTISTHRNREILLILVRFSAPLLFIQVQNK